MKMLEVLTMERTRICRACLWVLPICVIFAVAPPLADAQLLDYGPFAGYGLKKGILGNNFSTPLAACITGAPSLLPASHSGVRASITYSAEEYKRAFHVDQNAEASFLGIGGGGEELHFGQETGRSGSAFDIIIEAYSEHDSQTIDNVVWDSSYQTMLTSGDNAKIAYVREACGDRYIQTVFNETRLFAVMHVSNQQTSSLTTFRGKANGSIGIDVVSASAALGGDLNVSSANKSGALAIDIYTEGLGGLIPTAAAIGVVSNDGLQGVATKLAQYLTTLTDKGQPVKYRLAPFPGMPSSDLADSRIFEYLNDLKANYFSVSSRHDNVKSLRSNTDPRRFVLRQPQADALISKQENALEVYLNKVADAHEACRKAASLPVCVTAATQAGSPPFPSNVELSSLDQRPWVGSFMFLINGTPVPPGQSGLLVSNAGSTLLDAAKVIRADAATVDLLAPISNDYLSLLAIDVLAPGFAPTPVGSYKLIGQELGGPLEWNGAGYKGLDLLPIISTRHNLESSELRKRSFSNEEGKAQ